MSRLKAALVIGAALLLAGAGDAQAAKIRFPLWDFGLIDGLGTPPTLVLDPDRRIPAIDLDGDDDGKKPPITPGEKPSGDDWTTQYVDNPNNGDWSTHEADNPDSEDWQQTTATQDPPVWTMQTATNDNP